MSIRSLRMVLAAAVGSTLLGGVSQGETIPHGVPRQPGNSIPEGSQAICSGVPDGVALIANLETGWAIEQPGSGSLRLLFSDQPLVCREPSAGAMPEDPSDCTDSWRFALTLPPELQRPGTYELANQQVDFMFAVINALPASGCNAGAACVGGGTAGQAGGAQGPDGTLEIYSVTEECITGRFHRLETGLIEPKLDFTGAFHAVRCTPEP